MNKRTKRILKPLIFALFACFVIFQAQNVGLDDSSEVFTEHLENSIPALMAYYDIPGMNIAIIKDGKKVWADAFGYANVEKGIQMTTDTYCRVESISKSVTAWGIMKLVENGKIDLDVPIREYLTDWDFSKYKFSAERITTRMLLSHTAGMSLGTIGPDALYFPDEDIPPLQELLMEEFSVMDTPGKQFYYSDTGYNLLELLVETVTGQKFADYMQEEILIPLGMKHSSYDWARIPVEQIPLGYNTNKDPVPVYTYAMKASGNLFSTLDDITTFIIAGMERDYSNQQILNQESVEQLYDKTVSNIPGMYGLVFDAYGFGYFIEELSNGKKAISHGGQGTGWMTHFHSIPESGDGIVILSNSQRTWPAFAALLRDWSNWVGISQVGMTKIILGQRLIWAFIACLLFFIIWKIWELIEDLFKGKRKLRFFGKESTVWRMILVIFALIILTTAYMAVNMTYQPLFSIFPVASDWFFSTVSVFGFVLLFLGLFPVSKNNANIDANEKQDT